MRMIAAAIDGVPVAGFIPPPTEAAADGETPEEFADRRRTQAAADAEKRAEIEAANGEDRRNRARGRVAGFLARERGKAKSEMPPMTPQLAETIRRAFGGMLAVCDGAEMRDGCGFNKPDAFVAHVLLDAQLESDDALSCAFLMLKRYPRQNKSAYPELFA